jgi:MATE family multidrug resistance protein
MLRLAIPVVIAEIGWISMGIVDTVFVGPLGPAAIGAVGTGSTIFFGVIVFGMGMLYALDTYVSQSFGAGRVDECHRWLFAGLQLAAVMAVVLVAISRVGVELLDRAHIHPDVIVLLKPYLITLLWSVAPLMAYTVFRRYLQAMNAVRPVMIALVTANIVNALGNWLLVYGHWGFPKLGVVGSAYATLGARIYLAGVLFYALWARERQQPSGLHDVPFAIDRARMWALTKLGSPAAVQITLEVGVFATASAMAATIAPVAVAANQVVLNIVSFFFMVPLGISSAAAVRVGQAVGRRDPHGVRLAGWAALGITIAFALVMSLIYVVSPTPLLRLFSDDVTVLTVGATLLMICAVFQPFDGAQVVATGALRGLGDTHTAMLLNLGAHWFLGLPIAYWLCFHRGWGVTGLWTGLTISLVVIGGTLIAVWHARSRHVRT